jgi:hypothetical protein
LRIVLQVRLFQLTHIQAYEPVANVTLDFCYDEALHGKIMSAYNRLWDVIDANRDQLSHEVWTWKYEDGFRVEQLGALTNTESNIRQLWSLTFLAVRG